VPIKKQHEGLPLASRAEGTPPSKHPILVHRIAEAWFERYVAEGGLDYQAAIPELPYRASLAGSRCDRQMLWRMIGHEPSNPNTIADHWRMYVGNIVGGALGEEMKNPGAQYEDVDVMWDAEVNVDLRTIGIQGSAHADLVRYRYTGDDVGNATIDWLTRYLWVPDLVVELKTAGGFAFKRQSTSFSGPPSGPKYGHIVQGALAAAALGAPKLMVAYLALDMLSVGEAKKQHVDDIGRFGAEWHYMTEDIELAVEHERLRIKRLLHQRDHDILPTRTLDDPTEYPAGAVVVRFPGGAKAQWQVQVDDSIVDAGTTWMCDYCEFNKDCKEAGDGTVVSFDEDLF